MKRSGPTTHRNRRHYRTGAATLWQILSLPVLLIVLCVVVEIGNVWVARVELENALEASALAAVKQWGTNAPAPAVNWTNVARTRGTTLAAANTIREFPLVISLNQGTFQLSSNPNENHVCDPVKGPPPEGNLIFGKITENPMTGEWTFDASEAPSCGAGEVLLDATGEGNLQSAANNEWGIAFHNSPLTPSTLRINQIILDAQSSGGSFRFTGTPAVSSNLVDGLAGNAVRDNSSNSQADIRGFVDPVMQITFTISGGGRFLTIDFSAAGGDDGFAPGDRFRFGASVVQPPGNSSQDGDDVAGDVSMLVKFNSGAMATGTLVDTTHKKNECYDPRHIDLVTGTFVVSPSNVPDLPCPPTAAAKNNGQSYVLTSGSGQDMFGVRAQATILVPSLCCSVFGLPGAGNCVTAKATAMFTCSTRRARLVRIDHFICMPGNGAD